MENLKFSDKNDIVFDSLGRLSFITGDESLIQKLFNRFKLVKGDLFYNMEYGVPVIRGKINEEYLEVIISETISDLEEIDNFEIIDFRIDGKFAHATVNFYKIDGEELELNMEIDETGGVNIGN